MIFSTLKGSPKNMIPDKTVPAVPNPTKTAYTVPTGSFRPADNDCIEADHDSNNRSSPSPKAICVF